MPVRANVACTSSAALALGLLLAVSACGGDARSNPRLTPELAESLAGTEAYDSGSNVAIFCDALGFRDESRTWLVECVQEKKTSWVVDDQTKEVRQQGPKDTLRGDSVLAVADRTTLAICVEPVLVEARIADEAKARIEELMPSVEKHQYWNLAGLEGVATVVDIGCPGPPQLLQPTPADPGENHDPFVNPRHVNDASPYKVHVYIVPETVLDAIPGTHRQRRATEESICFQANSDCAEVTTGLYLTPKDLGDSAFMYAQLVRVIGLE